MRIFSVKAVIITISIFVVLLLIVSTGYGLNRSNDLKKEVEILADEILSKMSDAEKIGQIIHIAIPKNHLDPVAQEEIRKLKPGGIILFGMNFGTKDEIIKLNSDLQKEAESLGILPFLISTDQEGGRVIRVKSVQDFPGAMALGQIGNEEYTEKVGFITSYELNSHGINLLLAPVLDINNNPENPVINTRSFGSDLGTVLKMTSSYQKGALEGGAIPVVKHFPGHGDTNIDSHLGLPVIQKNEDELFQMELIPFQKSVEQGIRVVMSAHIVYPKLDPELPATLSSKILQGILRKKMDFDGVIITDAMEMKAIADNYFDKKPGKLAILAGADIILLTSWGKTTSDYKSMLEDAVKENAFEVEGKNLLNEAVKRQIILKLENGLIPSSCCKTPKIYLEKFLKEKREFTKKKYSEILSKETASELNRLLSKKSIRSFGKKFFPLNEKELLKTEFYVKEPYLKTVLKKMKLKAVKVSKAGKIFSKSKNSRIVLASENLEDLSEIQRILQKNPKRNIILLHYGSPFFEFPISENLQILFSFSPTEGSLEALGKSLSKKYRKTPVETSNLIFRK